MTLRNYGVTAWRNLVRRKGYNVLNILGLGTGLAVCLVIFLILQYEFSYDRYHKHASRIYEMVKERHSPVGVQYHISTPFTAITALRQDYPQIHFAQLFSSYGSQVKVLNKTSPTENHKFIEDIGVFYAEPELFDLFDVKWLSGSSAVLKDDNTVVLCQSLAEKYFGGKEQAIGQYIQLDNAITGKVAGIIADPPGNTDFPFRLLVSYRTFEKNSSVYGFRSLEGWGWGVTSHQIYALLPDNMDAATFNKNFPAFLSKYMEKESGTHTTYFFRPLTEAHFDTRFEGNGDHIIRKASLLTLSLIGLLILFMACINFVNLATALAIKRSKEIGVRKVMGSTRIQLILQVLADTALIVSIALGVAFLLADLSLPFIKYFSPIDTTLPLLSTPTYLFLLGMLVLVTLLSGGFPALQLSRFSPIQSIRSRMEGTRKGGISLRRVLVVLQFSFSQLLVIATLIAITQMNYIQTSDIGVTRDAVLLLQGINDSSFLARQPAFRDDLRRIAGIQTTSFSNDAPCSGDDWEGGFSFDHIDKDQPFDAYMKWGDVDYGKTFGLQMAAGQWYTKEDTSHSVVINETMAHKLNIRNPQDAIGKMIRLGGNGHIWRPIVGVVKDFKNASLREEVPPNIIAYLPGLHQLTAIRLQSNNLVRTTQQIEAVWNKYYPEYAYNSVFMDQHINNFYSQEQRLSASYKVYTILAILISCLGLYGLVSFMALQRTKEVGIRKVLGASVAHIVYLFSREFTVLILVAFLIAAPVAWWMMHDWLQHFVYRVPMNGWIFFFAILISLGIAWITVGYKSIRAALVNPTQSLKTE